MNRDPSEHKDIRDPTKGVADFRAKFTGGKNRWLASTLAFVGLAILANSVPPGKDTRLDLPWQVQGPVPLCIVGVSTAIWCAIAAVSWRKWFKHRSG